MCTLPPMLNDRNELSGAGAQPVRCLGRAIELLEAFDGLVPRRKSGWSASTAYPLLTATRRKQPASSIFSRAERVALMATRPIPGARRRRRVSFPQPSASTAPSQSNPGTATHAQHNTSRDAPANGVKMRCALGPLACPSNIRADLLGHWRPSLRFRPPGLPMTPALSPASTQ